MRLSVMATSLALSVSGLMIAFIGPAAAADDITSVPEPMSALLVGAGLVGLGIIRQRRNKEK